MIKSSYGSIYPGREFSAVYPVTNIVSLRIYCVHNGVSYSCVRLSSWSGPHNIVFVAYFLANKVLSKICQKHYIFEKMTKWPNSAHSKTSSSSGSMHLYSMLMKNVIPVYIDSRVEVRLNSVRVYSYHCTQSDVINHT